MPPLIVCGMHRSGTSMLCRLLESIGLFVGHEKEHNHEALFFLEINQWIFDQLGARWDQPYNMRFINEPLREYLVQVLDNVTRGPSTVRFTGPHFDLQALCSAGSTTAWGWKDPRNTFTTSVWRGLFPDARLLHICRNPVDVAESLRQREAQILERHATMLDGQPRHLWNGAARLQQSPRLFHLCEGIALWEDYVEQAMALEAQFGDRALRVRYEDFLSQPANALARIAEFAGIEPTHERLVAATEGVDSQRAYAFMQHPELTAAYQECRASPVVRAMGYGAL